MLNNKKQNILIIPIAIAPLIGIIISMCELRNQRS